MIELTYHYPNVPFPAFRANPSKIVKVEVAEVPDFDTDGNAIVDNNGRAILAPKTCVYFSHTDYIPVKESLQEVAYRIESETQEFTALLEEIRDKL